MDQVPFDYGGALSALARYLDALHLRDPEMMRQVWHPSSHLKRVGTDGTLVDIPASRFLDIVGQASGDQVAEQHQQDRVLGLDFAGPCTVLAKVQVQLGQSLYTDFLSLLKLEQGWLIVSKLFTSRTADSLAFVDTAAPAFAHSEISLTLAEFITACRTSDASRLRAVLHPTCQTLAVRKDGVLREVTAEAFIERTGSFYAPLPLGEGAARYNKIISIDKSGPQTAVAKVQTGYHLKAGQLAVNPTAAAGDFLFTNYLFLMQLGGGWSIVSRVYTAEPI